MKKAVKVLVVAAVLTVMFALPCFAQELTKVNPDVTEEQFIAANAAHNATVVAQAKWVTDPMVDRAAASRHLAVVATQLKNSNREAADNYIDYRKKRVAGFKETERIKLEVVNNYKYLSQFNPYFATLIPAAEADYNNAVAVRVAEEAAVAKCTSDFAALYPR